MPNDTCNDVEQEPGAEALFAAYWQAEGVHARLDAGDKLFAALAPDLAIAEMGR